MVCTHNLSPWELGTGLQGHSELLSRFKVKPRNSERLFQKKTKRSTKTEWNQPPRSPFISTVPLVFPHGEVVTEVAVNIFVAIPRTNWIEFAFMRDLMKYINITGSYFCAMASHFSIEMASRNTPISQCAD